MLMRFDPFRDFDRVWEQMAAEHGGRRARSFPMDAYRRGDEFVVHFDLPGVDPTGSRSTSTATSSPCGPSAASSRSRATRSSSPSARRAPTPGSSCSATSSTPTASRPATTAAC